MEIYEKKHSFYAAVQLVKYAVFIALGIAMIRVGHDDCGGDSQAWGADKTCMHKTKKRGNLSILSFSVGITGLEPATSRPPDVCATNCAKSRSNSTSILTVVFECGCKGTIIF